MAKQSRLEEEAIVKQDELLVMKHYQEGSNEYNETHKDALSDGDPKGKGTGTPLGYTTPGKTRNKGISYSNMDTTNGGGQYDIEGSPEHEGGRTFLEGINLYSKAEPYGSDSVDTSYLVRNRGQYVVK